MTILTTSAFWSRVNACEKRILLQRFWVLNSNTPTRMLSIEVKDEGPAANSPLLQGSFGRPSASGGTLCVSLKDDNTDN